MDFLATHPAMDPLLIQVAATTGAPDTMAREVQSLDAAMHEHPRATPLLLTLDATVPSAELPTGARWIPASEWLLDDFGRRVA